jgi:hypothetical protein
VFGKSSRENTGTGAEFLPGNLISPQPGAIQCSFEAGSGDFPENLLANLYSP